MVGSHTSRPEYRRQPVGDTGRDRVEREAVGGQPKQDLDIDRADECPECPSHGQRRRWQRRRGRRRARRRRRRPTPPNRRRRRPRRRRPTPTAGPVRLLRRRRRRSTTASTTSLTRAPVGRACTSAAPSPLAVANDPDEDAFDLGGPGRRRRALIELGLRLVARAPPGRRPNGPASQRFGVSRPSPGSSAHDRRMRSPGSKRTSAVPADTSGLADRPWWPP